jgi:hypothetical protein
MAEAKAFDREAAIDELEEQDYQYIMNKDGGVEYLRNILFYGHLGYSNYTDAELIAELNERKALA